MTPEEAHAAAVEEAMSVFMEEHHRTVHNAFCAAITAYLAAMARAGFVLAPEEALRSAYEEGWEDHNFRDESYPPADVWEASQTRAIIAARPKVGE